MLCCAVSLLLQSCAEALAAAGISAKKAQAAGKGRLAARRSSAAGQGGTAQAAAAAAAAAAQQSDEEDEAAVPGSDGHQQASDADTEDSDAPAREQKNLRLMQQRHADDEEGSDDERSSSSSSDEEGGQPPAAGTGRGRAPLAGPAAAYSHMSLDELRAACSELGLHPKPSRKQVGRAGVRAVGQSHCCKQGRLFEVWQHVLFWLIMQATTCGGMQLCASMI
jgi:hypothetical protein